jgi:hypothetical protein
MEINMDLSPIINFLNLPADVMLSQFLWTVGWIPIVFTLFWGWYEVWLENRQNQWAGAQKQIFLAIDIPRGNIQSPLAVENIFNYLAGGHGTLNIFEKYYEGKIQLSFSFEIVSIDGYTQFMIRTPEKFRNLVESAIYSQYPGAEITEVNDYTIGMPKKFPDPEWDVWGVEFTQAADEAYPIKLYEAFEHKMGEDETSFRDPMAALMELTSSLRQGEQLWYQIIVKPVDMVELGPIGEKAVKKILKEEDLAKKTFLDKLTDLPLEAIGGVSNIISSMLGWEIIDAAEEKKDDALKMMNLKPRDKGRIEAISDKMAKVPFSCKIRFVYMAKKEVKNVPKVVNGFVGYMKQFADMNLNNLKPDMKRTATSAHFLFKEQRINSKKNKIVNDYMHRDGHAGINMKILNTAELATIWHFPVESVVKAPMIQKTAGRKAEPPMSLPKEEKKGREELMESIFMEEAEPRRKAAKPASEEPEKEDKGGAPGNLPIG